MRAATREFAAKGYAGTRMAGIAQAAKVNKELIFHHFKGKEDLFAKVRNSHLEDELRRKTELPEDCLEIIPLRFNRLIADIDWVKFITWEAAQGDEIKLPLYKERRRNVAQYVASLRREQDAGRLPRELNPRLLQLAIFALTTYPLAFSQITRLVTGRSAYDKRFQKEWTDFLRNISKRLLGRRSKRRGQVGQAN